MKDFSDEIYLVTITQEQDEMMQWHKTTHERGPIWSEVSGIVQDELTAAGQKGLNAKARCRVHAEDYQGETVVYLKDPLYWLPAGYYQIYRTWPAPEHIDLYIGQKEGVTYAAQG